MRYEQIPHTADLAVKVYGKTVPEIFENAAFAMFDLMGNITRGSLKDTKKIEIDAPDTETLLIEWLNELLYLSFETQALFSVFCVRSLENNKLRATAIEQIPESGDLIQTEIKAATYHDLKIEKTESGYEVTIVFDV
ncbi:MAG: archease [Candidatus Omnitrophica bacterium]|nr:archease [Candidatus Omnitrophota bacterium]MBU1894238.1 archease [Candidatus Omnitrophota bacterium]